MGTIILAVLMAFSVHAQDIALIEQVALEYDLPIKYIESCDWDSIESRTDDYLLVEVVESEGDGTHYGIDEDGYVIAYNKVVKQGEHVTSYVIYNPYSTYYDDVIAVIDNGMKR